MRSATLLLVLLVSCGWRGKGGACREPHHAQGNTSNGPAKQCEARK